MSSYKESTLNSQAQNTTLSPTEQEFFTQPHSMQECLDFLSAAGETPKQTVYFKDWVQYFEELRIYLDNFLQHIETNTDFSLQLSLENRSQLRDQFMVGQASETIQEIIKMGRSAYPKTLLEQDK